LSCQIQMLICFRQHIIHIIAFENGASNEHPFF